MSKKPITLNINLIYLLPGKCELIYYNDVQNNNNINYQSNAQLNI